MGAWEANLRCSWEGEKKTLIAQVCTECEE
jgi:hypothetical protein